MEVTIPMWQLLMLSATVLFSFFGFVFAVWKIVSKLSMALASSRADSARSTADTAHDKACAAECLAQDNERNLLRLRAELPLEYVRREDFIRNQTVIEAKLDALAEKFDKGGHRGS